MTNTEAGGLLGLGLQVGLVAAVLRVELVQQGLVRSLGQNEKKSQDTNT